MCKEFVGLSDVCDRRERPLTHRLLLHLPDALTHLNSHKQMAQCVADAENTKTLEKVFDKSQLCKVAKVNQLLRLTQGGAEVGFLWRAARVPRST